MDRSAPSLGTRLAPARLALHAEAFASVVAASLAIRLLPFPRVVASRAAGGSTVSRVESAEQVARLRSVVRAWCRRVPWRAKCFESAIALRAMLRRRGIAATLHYGMTKDEDLRAHVWLSVAGEVVIGGEVPGFKEVATFPPVAAR